MFLYSKQSNPALDGLQQEYAKEKMAQNESYAYQF
jgi:hypothetical protein